MNPLDGVSLDLALGVAQAVVLARFVSMLRVTWGMPALQAEVVRLLREESPDMRARLRQLSYTSPFAEAALTLLDRDTRQPSRQRLLKHAEALSRKEALLSARRGQNLDLFGLLLLSAGLVAAPSPWSGQPVTLLLGLGTLTTLGATLITRRLLATRLSDALSELRAVLTERSSVSPEDSACPFCGMSELESCQILVVGEESLGPYLATRCTSCGGLVSSTADEEASSPETSTPEGSAPAASSPGRL